MADKEILSNPAPLGLMGFGMTTVLLNMHNAGLYALGSMILSMGIFYGGLAQIFAGLLEYRKGNTFGTTAFCSYGLFWLSFVLTNRLRACRSTWLSYEPWYYHKNKFRYLDITVGVAPKLIVDG